jgi:hypothetical protein
MRWAKWLGVAGLVGVLGVASVAGVRAYQARQPREWSDLEPDELRDRLHQRLAHGAAGRSELS